MNQGEDAALMIYQKSGIDDEAGKSKSGLQSSIYKAGLWRRSEFAKGLKFYGGTQAVALRRASSAAPQGGRNLFNARMSAGLKGKFKEKFFGEHNAGI